MSSLPRPAAPALEEVYRSPAATLTGPAVSLVVPAFNESDRLDAGIARLWEAVRIGAVDIDSTEVLVVDDASVDGTARRAQELLGDAPHCRVLTLRHHAGKGACVRAGVRHARAAKVAFIDADMAILPTQLPTLLGALDAADLAIGARSLDESSVDAKSGLRDAGAKAFNVFVKLVTPVRLDDTQCGFKAFHTPVARLLFHFSLIDRFAFDVEILSVARLLDLRIAEVPVHWLRVRGSSIKALRDPLHMVLDVAMRQSGLWRPPPLPALVVQAPGRAEVPPTAVQEALGGIFPVTSFSDGAVLALLPLCDEAEQAHAARRVEAGVPEAHLRTTVLSLRELLDLAPLFLEHPPSCDRAAVTEA